VIHAAFLPDVIRFRVASGTSPEANVCLVLVIPGACPLVVIRVAAVDPAVTIRIVFTAIATGCPHHTIGAVELCSSCLFFLYRNGSGVFKGMQVFHNFHLIIYSGFLPGDFMIALARFDLNESIVDTC
jgi:hypothetical protein